MRATLAALGLATAILSPPAALADPVHFPWQASAGDTWSFTQNRSIQTNDPKKASGEAVVKATLKVLSVTADGYVMQWTTNTITTAGVTYGARGPVPEMMLGTHITYEADAAGSPLRVRDRDAVIAQAIAAAIGIAGDGKDHSAIEKLRTIYDDMTDEILATRFLQEASLIGNCQDLELDPAEPVTGQFEQDTGFGASILVNATVTLESVGSKTSPARIVIAQNYDPESAKAAVLSMLQNVGGEDAAQREKQSGKPLTLRHSSTITCHVDIVSGDAVRIVSDLDIETNGIAKRDIRTITLTRQ